MKDGYRFGRLVESMRLSLFYLGIIFISSFILLVTEHLPENNGIEYVFFEVISALATVGLSLGLTPQLTVVGKITIMILMSVVLVS